MFGTFRYSSQNDDSQFLGRVGDPSSLAPLDECAPRSLACDRCRSKKVGSFFPHIHCCTLANMLTLPLQQRCSGQKNGCDRCKRNSSACNYSPGARRGKRNDAQNKSGNPVSSPAETAPHRSRSSNKGELQDHSSLRRPSTQCSSPHGQNLDEQNLDERESVEDSFNPIGSPLGGSFDDGFTMTDRSANDHWDEMILPSPTGVGNEHSSQPTHNELGSADLTWSPCQTFSEFGMDSYLAPSYTSLQPCVSMTACERATPRRDPSVSTLARAYHDQPMGLGHHGPKTMPPASADVPARCQCLRLIEVLLEDLERGHYLDDPAALDSILAWQKRALSHCSTVLSCSACVARSEHILLLAFITERLATLCESTVSLYLKELQRRSSANGRRHSEESGTVFLGCYEIESKEEWSSLIRVLIVLQLRSLRSLLGDMSNAARAGTNAAQLPMVQATERRVDDLIQRLRRPVSSLSATDTGKVESE